MMMAIYKIEKTINRYCRYSGVGINKEDDCEYVAFHQDMINKHNARIILMQIVYCQGDDQFLVVKCSLFGLYILKFK